MNNIYAALEIGTTRTLLAVGEAGAGERLKVTCLAEIPSTGVRKSQILDIGQATQSIKSVLLEAEKKQRDAGQRITIGNVFLAVSGQHVKTDLITGTASIDGARVGDDELDDVANSAHASALPRDRELLDIVDQTYDVDNLGGITSPKGMSGRVLKLKSVHIHADANRIRDARTAADAAKVEVREALYAVTCAADAVLEEHERRNGALVIDLGGGSTGFAMYADGHLAATEVIGVGGDHVTSDIANAFQTTQSQAEELKVREASALLNASGELAARVKIPGSSPLMETRTISRRALNTVVNARMRELLGIIREELEQRDLLHQLHTGIVLTGGGAALRDVEALVQAEFGASVRIGRPIHVDGLDEVADPASFATIAGVLMYAHRNYEEKPMFSGLLKGLFK